MHADQQAAGAAFAPIEALDQVVDLAPAAQVDVADSEIGAIIQLQRRTQSGQQVPVDVVEYARGMP